MTVRELFEDANLHKWFAVLLDETEDDIALIRPQTHKSPRMDTTFRDWIDGEVLDKKQTWADSRNPVWYIKVKKCKKVLDKTDEV